jgi:hypothetical protein
MEPDAAHPDKSPAGVATLVATWNNTSDQIISDISVVVSILTGGNWLLNADDEPGQVGATMTIPNDALGSDGVLTPGESGSVEFLIGLLSYPFDFFVQGFGTVEPAIE